jgi:hypothetical protein
MRMSQRIRYIIRFDGLESAEASRAAESLRHTLQGLSYLGLSSTQVTDLSPLSDLIEPRGSHGFSLRVHQ